VAGLAGRDATGRPTWYYARCVPESTGDLVGRRAELDILQGALVDLETGAPRVVQIAGERGIGKTRLVAVLRAEAEWAHHLVVSGRPAEFEDGEAFGVLVDALDDYLALVDPRDLERLNLELAELAWVFPALARLAEGPLGEAAKLLGTHVGAAMAHDLYLLTGGNPFYLEQLVRAGHRVGAGAPPGVGSNDVAAVPVAVLGVITEELAALSAPACALIRGAAVVGDPFEVGLAASAGEVSPEEEFAALDELRGTDLVCPGPDPCRFTFRGPLVRHAVYEGAGAGWRIGAHARAAAALEAEGGSAAVRAHHVERSARPGDAAAVDLLIEAGHLAAGRAPAAAARWYEAALWLMPGPGTASPPAGRPSGAGAHARGHRPPPRRPVGARRGAGPRANERRWPAATRPRQMRRCRAAPRRLRRRPRSIAPAISELPDPMSPEVAALSLGHAIYNVFAKLGVSSRAAVACVLARHPGAQ
jgi:hypothetical protein